MRRLQAMILASLLALTPAAAHDAEKGPNGGPQLSVGDRHLELTREGASIVVYVTDASHAPVVLTGAKGRAVVQDAGKTMTIELAVGEGHRLVGKVDQPLGKGARIVVSATLPDGKSVQARFVAN